MRQECRAGLCPSETDINHHFGGFYFCPVGREPSVRHASWQEQVHFLHAVRALRMVRDVATSHAAYNPTTGHHHD